MSTDLAELLKSNPRVRGVAESVANFIQETVCNECSVKVVYNPTMDRYLVIAELMGPEQGLKKQITLIPIAAKDAIPVRSLIEYPTNSVLAFVDCEGDVVLYSMQTDFNL